MNKDKRKGIYAGYKKLGPTHRFTIKIALLGILLAIAFFIFGPSRNNQEEMLKSDKKTHDKLDIIDDKLSKAIDSKDYAPLKENLKSELLQSLQSMNKKNLTISIRITQKSRNKELIGRELEGLLKSGGFGNTKYGGEFQLYTRNEYPSILISCHASNINFAEKLNEALKVFLNTQFGIKPENGIPKNKIQITILDDPFFNNDGTVIFKNISLPQEEKPKMAVGSEKPKTLYDCFKSQNFMKISNSVNLSKPDSDEVINIEYNLCIDSESNSKFMSYFVPLFHDSSKTYEIILSLIDFHSTVFDRIDRKMPAESYIPGDSSYTYSKDLKFSRIIYVYHAGKLSLEHLGEISKQYKSKGLTIQLRDQDYALIQNLSNNK